jgi:hypothetical protein
MAQKTLSPGRTARITTLVVACACVVPLPLVQVPQRTQGAVVVQGTVRTNTGQSLGGAQINFIEGKNATTVYSDANGRYMTNLRPGAYTMNVLYGVGPSGLWSERPLFQTRPNRHLFFDVYFEMTQSSCDMGTSAGHELTKADYDDACGGTDSFEIKSDTGSAFTAEIHFRSRRREANSIVYSSGYGGFPPFPPVNVAYNLFSVRANEIVYDVQTSILTASHAVEFGEATARLQEADTVRVKLKDGTGVILPTKE